MVGKPLGITIDNNNSMVGKPLGITIDNNNSMVEHIKKICKQASNKLNALA